MERCSYGFYTKRTEPVDSVQKKKDQEKEPQSPGYQQLSKSADKHNNENQNINVPVSQHVPAQQLLSPSHTGLPHPSKDDSKDKTLLKVANSTTITLIENGTLSGDKDYPKNYFTLESKIDKKDDSNKNSITITKTVPKQSPSSQADKNKGQAKPNKRPLQYLETLAEKAGITFEDKYEAANTLLALDKQNTINRRPPELKQPKTEPENHNSADDYNRYRNQKEEDDKLQIQQQIIQQQQQQQQHQQLQQLQQLQQQQLQQLQQQALQRQHQQVLQQHIKNQQDQQELLQKQFQQQQQQQQQQQKPELLQVTQSSDGQQKFLQPLHTQQFNVPGIGEINLSFLASPQNNVNLVFDKNQKSGMSAEIKPQQIVDGQTQVVQQQISMSQHDSSQQHHQTVTVVSSMPSSMAHQVQQQQQAGSSIQQQAGQLPSIPPLHSLPQNAQQPQQLSTEWGHSRVQVIQQPLTNNAYLQQLYNTQGPLIMPGNIALHPGINSQQIQVIAAGKPFQGNQLAPHMLAQGKQVLQGQAAPFPGYTTIPTTQNQTLVFSPLSVIHSQPSILPAHSQPTVSGIGQKQGDMHKCGGKVTAGKVGNTGSGGQTVQTQCVQVSQPVLGTQQPTQAQIISPLQAGGQPMQFAPWQISGALPQVWTGGLPTGTIPTGGLLAPNPTLFIRGNQPDQTSMFIQHSPQNVQQNTSIACSTATGTKPRASADGMSKGPRPLSNILPSGVIRPAASVSTQTNQAQTNQDNSEDDDVENAVMGLLAHQIKYAQRCVSVFKNKKRKKFRIKERVPRARVAQGLAKLRGKPGVKSPAPAANKQDAANQTNQLHKLQQAKQQLLVMNPNGQMTQITSVQDKQALTKNMQQQALMQQQLQQQQQQQQLMHQQQQNQQMVQHYQQQAGMQMSMQQGGLPVASMAGMPQTISMVQQIHPLSGMTQQGTLVGQLNTQTQNQINQVQAMQQQQQSLVSGGMVQTNVAMGSQQQGLTHSAPMQTPSITIEGASVMSPILQVPTIPYNMAHAEVAGNSVSSPQLTLQGPGVGLIATPMQGSVLPLPQTLVAHVKSEDDKMPPPQPAVIQHSMPLLTDEPEPAPAFSSAVTATVTTTTTVTSAVETTSSTTSVLPQTNKSPQKATTADTAASIAPPVPSSAQHTTSHSSQVVTTVASSTSVTSAVTTAVTASVSSGHTYKGTQSSGRNASQTATSEVKTVSPLPASELGTKGALDNIYYKGLPKAMVKPNILTHVIEGYVIQEAAEPFAVNRPLREWGTSNSASNTAAANAASTERAEAREAREARDTRESRDTRDAREPRETREIRETRENREPRESRDSRDKNRESRDKNRESRDKPREREGHDKEAKRSSTSDEPPRKKQMLENKNASRISSSISSSRDEAEAGPSKSCRNQPREPDQPEEPKLSVANKWSSKSRRNQLKEQEEPERPPKEVVVEKRSSKSRRHHHSHKEHEQIEAPSKNSVPDKLSSKSHRHHHKEPVVLEEKVPVYNKWDSKSKRYYKPMELEATDTEFEDYDYEEGREEPKGSIADDWTVNQVCEFVRNIPGCGAYADDFLMQEVDGEALLLIKPEHLVMALSMKLGPALKIVACIDALRPEGEQNDND